MSCNSYVVNERFYISKTEKCTFRLNVNKSNISNEKDNLEIDIINSSIKTKLDNMNEDSTEKTKDKLYAILYLKQSILRMVWKIQIIISQI